MPIDLYCNPLSPPSKATIMTAGLLGIQLNKIIKVPIGGDLHTPEYLKLNPTHTIPVMVEGDFVLIDSHSIMTYFCEKFDKSGKYYPKDVKKRALVDQFLHYDSSKLFSAWRDTIIPIVIDKKAQIEPEKWEMLHECYRTIETFLGDKQYLIGDEVTIADICCVSTVSVAELLDQDLSPYPKIKAWIGRLKKLPNYKEVQEDCRDSTRQVFMPDS